jgi:hypothetical protein
MHELMNDANEEDLEQKKIQQSHRRKKLSVWGAAGLICLAMIVGVAVGVGSASNSSNKSSPQIVDISRCNSGTGEFSYRYLHARSLLLSYDPDLVGGRL